MDWIVGGLLIVAGVVAGWFVSKDATNFVLLQGVTALLLFMLLIAVLTFWPTGWSRFLKGGSKSN